MHVKSGIWVGYWRSLEGGKTLFCGISAEFGLGIHRRTYLLNFLCFGTIRKLHFPLPPFIFYPFLNPIRGFRVFRRNSSLYFLVFPSHNRIPGDMEPSHDDQSESKLKDLGAKGEVTRSHLLRSVDYIKVEGGPGSIESSGSSMWDSRHVVHHRPPGTADSTWSVPDKSYFHTRPASISASSRWKSCKWDSRTRSSVDLVSTPLSWVYKRWRRRGCLDRSGGRCNRNSHS